MAKRKFSYVLLIIAFALLAVFSVGGCGSSKSNNFASTTNPDNPSSPDTPEVVAPTQNVSLGTTVNLSNVDSDGDNIPDVLDFGGVTMYYINNLTDTGQFVSYDKVSNVEASVPFMTWVDALRIPTEPNLIQTELAAGVPYTLEFSNNFYEPLGARIPDIDIYNPDDELISEGIQLSVYPSGNPAVICYTFTPTISGLHTFRLSSANGNLEEGAETDGILFVYRELSETSEKGRYTHFMLNDEYEASVSELIQLRKNYLEANADFLKEVYGPDSGANVGRNAGPTDADYKGYDIWQGIMLANIGEYGKDAYEDGEGELDEAGFSASATGTQIPAVIYDVPYESSYQLGNGFMATTNLMALNTGAVEDFRDQITTKPTTTSTTTNYLATFISSKEDYEQKMGKNFSLSLAKNALGLSSSVQSTNNYKFGMTSTTLIIHYDVHENEYRYLKNNSDYKLTSDALQIFSDYPAAEAKNLFRTEYGDYFVAGYQYGGMYEASISITTDTTEQLQTLKTEFGAKIQSPNISADAKFESETRELFTKNNARVTVQIRTVGAGANTPEEGIINLPNSRDVSAISDVFSELAKFRTKLASSFDGSNYAPINVMLKRYRSLSGMLTKLDAYIPVPPERSAKIMALNRELVNMRGYWNVISTLEDQQIDPSVKNAYGREFYAIVDTISTGGNSFYTEAPLASMDRYINASVELGERLKAIGDRYTFYRMLVNAQLKEPSLKGSKVINQPFGTNGGTTGYKSFGVSAAVTQDLKDAGDIQHESKNEGAGVGWVRWRPELSGKTDERYCWINVQGLNENDNERYVVSPPAVGKNNIKFYFESGYDRSGKWDIYAKKIYMPRSRYPFNGLTE